MPRIKFLEDFEYKPIAQQTFLYKKDDVVLVTHEIAEKAIKLGKAENTEFPSDIPAGINNTISKFKNRKRNTKTNDDNIDVDEENINEIIDRNVFETQIEI
jgi:hypothetical protein